MKIRIKFRKQGIMKFIGHLDIMRYFQKVMRRADVDIRYSGGFSPHQVMSFAAPLGVGLLSNGEYLDIEVLSTDASSVMVRRMNEVMSEGMEILSYRRLDDSAKSAMSLVAAADYVMMFRPEREPEDMDAFFQKLREFYGQDHILISKKTKKGQKEMDLKPLIYRLERARVLPPVKDAAACDERTLTEMADSGACGEGMPPEAADICRAGNDAGNGNPADSRAGAGCGGQNGTAAEAAVFYSDYMSSEGLKRPCGDAVFMQVSAGSTDNVRPELVMEAFYHYAGWEFDPFVFQTEREEVYADLGSDGIRRLTPLEELGEEIEQTDYYQDLREDPHGPDGGEQSRPAGV